ncbi:hypothetical protein EJD97_021906 [Solanum chilense]|uniref:Uncharacterized protein n=1 Tax=Solanum chilense TaxID=4083 RepID=A0A6N2AD95_SOLCI|nr:hypothetical protein EJD97_021906 [Solanum chilense]
MDVQSPSKRFTRGSMSKSNTMQKIISKLRNDPTRFVDEGVKDHADVVTGSSTKMKVKTDIYVIHNDKNEVVGSGSFEHHKVFV